MLGWRTLAKCVGGSDSKAANNTLEIACDWLDFVGGRDCCVGWTDVRGAGGRLLVEADCAQPGCFCVGCVDCGCRPWVSDFADPEERFAAAESGSRRVGVYGHVERLRIPDRHSGSWRSEYWRSAFRQSGDVGLVRFVLCEYSKITASPRLLERHVLLHPRLDVWRVTSLGSAAKYCSSRKSIGHGGIQLSKSE